MGVSDRLGIWNFMLELLTKVSFVYGFLVMLRFDGVWRPVVCNCTLGGEYVKNYTREKERESPKM